MIPYNFEASVAASVAVAVAAGRTADTGARVVLLRDGREVGS